MCTDDIRPTDVNPTLLSYIDEINVYPRRHQSMTSSTLGHCYHQCHHHQHPVSVVSEPAPASYKRPFDFDVDLLHSRHPMTSPPPYWPMTSTDYDTSNNDRHRHRRHELRHDDVTSPLYAEKVVAELIETERTYVAELQQIVQVLRQPTYYLHRLSGK